MSRIATRAAVFAALVTLLGCGSNGGRAVERLPTHRHEPAPRLVFRQFHSGATVPDWTLSTYELTRSGGRATIAVTRKRTRTTGLNLDRKFASLIWVDAGTEKFHGDVTTAGGTETLTLTGEGSALTLVCSSGRAVVGPPDARLRFISPNEPAESYDEYGDDSITIWSSPGEQMEELLTCSGAEERDLGVPLLFAVPPGVEYLQVENDGDRGDGLRAIPEDGSVTAPWIY